MAEKERISPNKSISWLGGRYAGGLNKGVPHGKGRLVRSDGSKYDGEWLEGKPHGFGTIYYPGGGVYRGSLKLGKRHGKGYYRASDGKEIFALWQDGKIAEKFDIEEADSLVEPGSGKIERRFSVPERSLEKRPAISVNKLSHFYGSFQAVNDISFEVFPGEILGFLGPNGAGKSTTIKVLTGQLALKGGEAHILGRPVGKDDSELQSQIGVTFEEKNLYLEMTALENLNFFASLFGIRNPGSMEALQRVGLAERARERVANYSKGMRQRLMIARAFINKPQVLFLDEPTDGLDPVTATAIRRTIKEEAERGAAVLLTTHNMFEADELSDRVAFINEGKILVIDTAENLKLKYGKRSVKVRFRDDGNIHEEELAIEEENFAERLSGLVSSPELLTIHTEEATLEAIFIHLTGRRLAG